MKRTILGFVLAACIALPTVAAAQVHGVYIAPKFLFGIQDTGQISGGEYSGVKLITQHSQAVFGGALAVGFNFAPKFDIPVRAEFEYALRSNSSHSKNGTHVTKNDEKVGWSSKHSLNITTLFVNAYFDIDTGTAITPFVGAGLGMSFISNKVSGNAQGFNVRYSRIFNHNSNDSYFAWNLGAGVSYTLTENIALDLGYRFMATGYYEVKQAADGGESVKGGSNPYINELYLGARFTF